MFTIVLPFSSCKKKTAKHHALPNSTSKPNVKSNAPKASTILRSDTIKYVEPIIKKEQSKLHQSNLAERNRQRLLRNQETPTFRLDTVKTTVLSMIQKLENLDCKESASNGPYDLSFNKTFPHSSDNTHKYDGAVFCLKSATLPGGQLVRISYGRNEGGHISDQVTLVSITKNPNKIYSLPLSYQTRIEGHQTIVTSDIKDQIVSRKITQRYGDSNSHPDSLAQQARREILQTFLIQTDGHLQTINEKINQFNIE